MRTVGTQVEEGDLQSSVATQTQMEMSFDIAILEEFNAFDVSDDKDSEDDSALVIDFDKGQMDKENCDPQEQRR